MDQQEEKALGAFRSWKIYAAIIIGLSATVFLFFYNYSGQNLEELWEKTSHPNWYWLIAALVVLLIRDLGYIYRIKHLTSGELTWKGSVFTIILWEFASALTPSVVGGTAAAVFILNKEGIATGKSVAYVTLTAILDNLFFIIGAPIAILIVGDASFFNEPREIFGFIVRLDIAFYLSYSLIALYTIFMVFGVLISPVIFQKIIIFISELFRFSKRLKNRIYRVSLDNITASEELKGKSKTYWFQTIISTIFVWLARYLMLNCIFAAYFDMSIAQHGETLAKQVVLWITQLISPTPGAAGFAEGFLQEIFEGGAIVLAIAIIWRVFTYYGYLIAGAIALPKWLKRVSINHKRGKKKKIK